MTDKIEVIRPMLEAALSYHQVGFSVIPVHQVISGRCTCKRGDCKSPGKHPRVDWKKYTNTGADEQQIRKWWKRWPEASVGIVTGEVSNLVVLDIDGDEGRKSIGEASLELPETPLVHTGGGGEHYYFRYPEEGLVRATKSRILPGVDIRADGGFVVAPPSWHASGDAYRWREGRGLEDVPLAPLPERVLEMLESASEMESPKTNAASVLKGVSEGERDHRLYRYASSLRGRGVDREEAEILVLYAAANCNPPFPEDEALAKVEGAYKHPTEAEKSLDAPPVTFTAAELAQEDLLPIRWLIPGILPEGLSILAGPPKSGKSFLALEIALSLSTGTDLCGFDDVVDDHLLEDLWSRGDILSGEPTGVLYLDLEMSLQTIRQRINRLLGVLSDVEVSPGEDGSLRIMGTFQKEPTNLHFATEWPPIGAGFGIHLENFLESHPDVKMVVVDVLKAIRPRSTGSRNVYDVDYETIKPLQNIAKKRGISILLLHHTRKNLGGDSLLDAVSGSYGLTGAADAVLTLMRKPPDAAELHITGRLVMNQEITMRHQFPSGLWLAQGDGEWARLTPDKRDIIVLLRNEDEAMTPKQIAEALDQPYETIKKRLQRMARSDLIVRSGGKYSYPVEEEQTAD